MSILKIASALYSGQDEVPLLKALPGNTTTRINQRGPVQTGLCMNHPNSNAPEPHNAKISTAAFFLDAVQNGSITCAVGGGQIYGELKVKQQIYRFHCDGTAIKQETVLPKNYECIPIVLYAVIHSPSLSSYFSAFKSKVTLEHILQFCDSFWYDFAKTREEVNVELDLDLHQIKASFQFGVLNTCMEINPTICELFKNVTQRTLVSTEPSKIDFKAFTSQSHKIEYNWEESQKNRIRSGSLLEDFVPTEAFYKIMQKIDFRVRQNMMDNLELGITDIDFIKNDFVNILLWGDPGTGKTTLANAVSALTGMPIYEATINEDSEDDEFEGKNKIVKGSITFVETAFLEGFQNGGIILLEEINLARANVFTSVINQAIEYPYILKRNGYERIVRHPLTVIIATMNLDTEGTSTINSSSSQRLLSKYEIEEPTENECKSMLMRKGFPEKEVRYVYRIYSKVRSELKSSEQKRRYLKELSIRQCIGALMSIQEGIDPKSALIDSIYGSLAVKNKKVADSIKASHLDNMVDYASFQ